jgi:hypothetical protein
VQRADRRSGSDRRDGAAAFPITYVVPRRPFHASKLSRAVMKGFLDWLRGAEAAEQFRSRGMMLVADGPPETAPVDPNPPADAEQVVTPQG